MENPKEILKFAILNRAREYQKTHKRSPHIVVLSFLLCKVLLTRQLAKQVQNKQERVYFDTKEFNLEIRCAPFELGDSFNFIGNREELDEYIADHILLSQIT